MALNLENTNFPDPSEPIVSCHYSTRGGAIQICKYDIMDKFKVKDNCELPSTMPQGKRRKLKNKLGISRKDSKSDSQGSEDMS
ncbi:hypothetical protein FRB99_003180 [Tulasnella sp. 403]|nr:hypothetical protein FRB99_003180 [Tulasnella sp. 403]